tara:strand:- start:601 stop:828 length:228 start_codon:yes stop_codon:yes gene_type:complete
MYKTFIKNHTISTAIILFIIIYIFCIIGKPAFMFNKNGAIRHFGLGKRNSTIIPIWLLVIILAIMIYMGVLCYLR